MTSLISVANICNCKIKNTNKLIDKFHRLKTSLLKIYPNVMQ